MNLPFLNPLLASSALSAFRAHLETGQMSIPFFVPGEEGGVLGVIPKVLTSENVWGTAFGLAALTRMAEPPEAPWQKEIFSTPNRMHFSNPDTGQAVHIEIGTAIARGLTESSRGFAVSCRRFGDFGGTSMTVAFEPTLKKPDFHLLYELELTEAGLLGLRNLLGLEESLPVYDLSLRLFHRLALQGDAEPRNPYAELGQESLQNEWSGTELGGAFVTIIGGLDDALSETYGDIAERLRIEISPNEDSPSLPDPLKSIWAFTDQVAADSNPRHRADEIRADRTIYRDWVRRIYGTDSIPPSGKGKD